MSFVKAFWPLTTVAIALLAASSSANVTAADCQSAQLCVAAGSAEGAPGALVVFDVTLVVDEYDSTVLQNDVLLPNGVHISAQAAGSPDCVVDSAVGQPYATAPPDAWFAFVPQSCVPDIDCVGVHAFVGSDAALGAGKVLYRCTARIAPDVAPGLYPVQVTALAALSDDVPACAINDGVCDPTDPAYPLLGLDGEISVLGPPGSTPLAMSTPQPTRTPTPTETPCAPFCPGVVVGSASAVPGEEVTVAVTFRGGHAEVSGVQADIAFDPSTPIVACAVNPALNKGFTSIRIVGEHVRALVLGLDTSVLIPDGALLYTCTVDVAPHAAPGAYPLRITNVAGSTPLGQAVPMVGDAGQVVVVAQPSGATPLPTRPATPTPSPRPTIHDGAPPKLDVTSLEASAGDRVTVVVRLFGGNPDLVAIENDVSFEPAAFVVSGADGRPDCAVDPSIGASDAFFMLLPVGCQAGVDCDTIRAHLAAPMALQPDPLGASLYTCAFRIGAAVPPGVYPLVLSGVALADLGGVPEPVAVTDGAIEVLGLPGVAPLPTWTRRPMPTVTVTPAPAASLTIGSAAGAPGTLTAVEIRLQTAGYVLGSLDLSIGFDSVTPIIACAPGPNTFEARPVFDFQAAGCTPGIDCYDVHARLTALDPEHGIAGTGVLYTCTIRIPAGAAPGTYALRSYGVGATDASGAALLVTASDGSVTITGPSAAPSPTPRAPGEPPGPPTDASDPAAPVASGAGGCSMRRDGDSLPAWLLFLGALPPLLRTTRRRGCAALVTARAPGRAG